MPENRDTISREAAKNALCQLCRDISNWRMCERNDECNLICRIDGVPAADVREVVYCRECKPYKPQEKKSARWENRAMMCTRSATIKMPPDGFCSFGIKTDVTDINVGNTKEAE